MSDKNLKDSKNIKSSKVSDKVSDKVQDFNKKTSSNEKANQDKENKMDQKKIDSVKVNDLKDSKQTASSDKDFKVSKTISKSEDKKPEKIISKTDTKETSRNNKKINESNSRNPKSTSEENGEFVEKLVSINRVAKVVKGGRRFSFAALVVVGDGNGMVGHGKGKAKEVPEAIKKATEEAKLNMLRVPLRQGRTLHHDISGRFDSGNVYLRSAPSGTGVIAGGPMRAVFEALGIQDIVAKSVGSSNPHNMIRATFEALKMVSSPKMIATRRGLKINDITKRRKFSRINQTGVQDG
tara:strand:+ start:348 stop:1232 length:885 start_codon:yes stop_codon:yes gene_type:complete